MPATPLPCPPPSTLLVLSLSNKVLLPSIVTKFTVTGTEARALLTHVHDYIVCVPQNGDETLSPIGCTARILHIDTSLPEQAVLQVQGVCRSKVLDLMMADGVTLEARVEHVFYDKEPSAYNCKTLLKICQDYTARMRDIGVSPAALRPLQHRISRNNPMDLAHLMLCLTESSLQDKLHALEITDPDVCLEWTMEKIHMHLQTLQQSKQEQETIENAIDKHRRNFYLRHQFHAIHAAAEDTRPPSSSSSASSSSSSSSVSIMPDDHVCLPANPEDDEELADLIEQLNQAQLPLHAQRLVRRDIQRLRKLPPSQPESGVIRVYLEVVADLPWQQKSDAVVDIAGARRQLDADHYGIEHVKRRILEYLSVVKVKQDLSPPILCLVGPPGVGKTTLARSVATALRRKFHRISLGSVRDEADIRGHRRTYVAAMPGQLINGMRRCNVKNPVFLLDEIDKVIQNSQQGDPAAAMLEVLDPGQNATFVDHFLNMPFDLSQVLFIATANSLESISGPLRDRMEVVHLSGYTTDEKLAIARAHLLPKQTAAHGLSALHISDDCLNMIIENYTQESGVRNLDRTIAAICRYQCHRLCEDNQPMETRVEEADLENILGMAPFIQETAEENVTPGMVNGLAYMQSGMGGLLVAEANQMPGRGRLRLTGSLGDVIKESAYIAVSWVKANAYTLHLTQSAKQELLPDMDLHIHLPSGAVPKDGPSAGVTMVMCILSLLSGHTVSRTTAMTGEITLRGQVRPVGGIREKVIAAHRAGMTRLLIPAANRRDVQQDVPEKVQNAMTFVYCKTVWEAVQAAFEQWDAVPATSRL